MIAEQKGPLDALRAKVASLNNGTIAMTPAALAKKKRQKGKYRDEWAKRKRQCRDVLENLADGLEKKIKDVEKMLEIETDELARCELPAKEG